MNADITKPAKFDLTTLNPEQKVLYGQLKSFAEAEEISAIERKTYAYLKGRAANALKEITEHDQFTALVLQVFPEQRVRWLQYCMNFAKAVDTGKNAPLKFIPDNRLLKGGELTPEEKEKVSGAIDKATGDKGIMTVITDWKKKLARAKAAEAPEPDAAAEAKQRLATAVAKARLIRTEMALLVKLKYHVLLPDDDFDQLEEDRITFGRELADVKKHRKAKKPAK